MIEHQFGLALAADTGTGVNGNYSHAVPRLNFD
jgi:hypothetical protein